jgi:glycosyltransferase involved in cell wall biosynthesis
LLYPAGDIDALAALLIRLLTDPALRRRLGAAARTEVQLRWGWKRVLPKLLRVYSGVTAGTA